MSRLTTEIKTMKQNLVLEKAAQLFEIYGYEDLKISDLAKEVGVSVGTIYAYFDSKEGLYSAFVLSEIEKVYERLQALYETEISFEAFVEASIEIKFDVISQKRVSLQSGVFNNPFFFEAQQLEHQDAFKKLYKLYIDPIEKIKNVGIDSWQLVYILNAITNAYVLRWIEGEYSSFDGKAKEVTAMFMNILKGK